MSCSSRKRHLQSAPALELYDGVFFRILRKSLPLPLDIYILSAKYALIKAEQFIEWYDKKLVKSEMHLLRERTFPMLVSIIRSGRYEEVFLAMGGLYAEVLRPFEAWAHGLSVIYPEGGIGQKMHQLKGWLNSIKNT